MTVEITCQLEDWEREIEREIGNAYRDVVCTALKIVPIRQENYFLTYKIVGTFIDALGRPRTEEFASQLRQWPEVPLVVDIAELLSGQYNVLPVRDAIHYFYCRCNGVSVDEGDKGNPWGPRIFGRYNKGA